MNDYPMYKVNGVMFDNGDEAEWYARQNALTTGKAVVMMEKIDEMTPWHVCCTITDK